MANPWMTSDDLIAAVKRKISFPAAQATFTEDEILLFANEEMMISQVPSVLGYHEEYFVTTKTVALEANKDRYPIPERAIGMKLRDLFYVDDQDNLFEMTRVQSEDRAFFQSNVGAQQSIHKFYLEGNDVVITPTVNDQVTGSLLFVYYLRPNQLVDNDRAAIIEYFTKDITLTLASIAADDTVTIGDEVFTAVSSSPSTNQFEIGATAAITATNLAAAIVAEGTYSETTAGSNVVTVRYTDLSTEVESSNSAGFAIQDDQGIQFEEIPDNIEEGSIVDFLQTKPGHRTRAISVTIPSDSISSTIIAFDSDDVPTDLVIGDYICLENECIIPQIPTDLHTSLAERTSARILASIGDQQGLAAANQKIGEIENKQGPLLDNRVEGAPQKVLARHSLLRFGKRGIIRRT